MYTHSTIHVYNYIQSTVYTVYNSKVLMLLYMEQVLPIGNTCSIIIIILCYIIHSTPIMQSCICYITIAVIEVW